ncbi:MULTISPECIES: class I adenylate-forming enzyme family protein [unclassified Streptomyces]|uniref:class I adenylate-forming enzyme family protein n=1 Tax=unclassified Streptomyces TaxID=2593676 RepID=UPI00166078FF|nr:MULTISPECIES: class I adenylate-forming enzyme family protein [unclassified Streptomyces]MBD0710632.1 AMP-dependent synthetase [Streptomyces sp. CBMA291]MBD0715479.1 AMP-dependent synthetase [Streptomyces sp. CBMA370]
MTTTPPALRTGAPWRSRNGLDVPDRVPRADREAWQALGLCPDADLFTLFRERVHAHPEREAVVDERGALTYRELYAEVLRIAGLYAEAGLGARDVIALRLPNGRLAVAAELAVYALGAVALPYPLGGGIRDTRSLLTGSRAAGAVLGTPEDLEAAAGLPWPRALFTPATEAPEGVRRLDGAPARGPFRPADRPAEATAPARFLVSSGSETEPKMIAYSHQAMAGGRAAYLRALTGPPAGPLRLLVLVPLASSYGSLGVPVALAALGATLITRERFDAADALRAIAAHRPCHVFGVPTMLRRMADLPRLPDEDTSALRALVSSGAALPASTASACRERFGVPVVTVYGSSDGVNCHTADPSGETAGTPDPAVASFRIVRPDGSPAAPGEPGEIQAKGPMSPLCHVGAPALDARYRTASGWVRSGDLGALDGAGRLRVLGRLKNVVLRGGYTISPAEVEQELGTDPLIAEAVCVPVPDEEFGERLCACVRPAPGAPAPVLATVLAHLESRGLERRKFPEYLLVLDRVPVRPTGKPCRRTLAVWAAEAAGALGVLGGGSRTGADANATAPVNQNPDTSLV